MPYLIKLVSSPMQSGKEVIRLSWSQSLSKSATFESLLNRNPIIVHDRASFDCRAICRSFPYGFHLPSLQFSFDIFPVKELEKKRSPR